MILVDYQQAAIAAVTVNIDTELSASEQNKYLIKHLFFSMLLNYSRQFKKYGKIVICCDSRKGYWRKDYFPYYKGDRERAKEESAIDWKFVYSVLDELKEDLVENFRYPVIDVDKAEADDIIAVLCEWSQTNGLVSDGLFSDEPEDIVILSNDGDFYQLQKYKNVRQWAPRMKKFVTPKVPVSQYLIEHIVKAGDDGIPNILSPDNSIVDKIRQKSIYANYLANFVENGEAACKTDDERRNWKRNKTLIDFDCIPDWLRENIVKAYIEYEPRGSKTKVMSYFSKNRFRKLIESISEF